MPRCPFFLSALLLLSTIGAGRSAEPPGPERYDVSQWAMPEDTEEFFNGRAAYGADALTFWMQSADYRSRHGKPGMSRTQIERLWSGEASEQAKVNAEVQEECRGALKDVVAFRKKGARQAHMWILLALRAREQLTPETHGLIAEALRAMDLTHPDSGYVQWLEVPGGNGANVHGHLTALALGSELIHDDRARAAAYWGFRRELAHMNTTGDLEEFNLLESHWTGTVDWEIMKRYVSDPPLRRMARMIAERVWINRFLTWSSAVERNTGPGSRMAPSEWLGCDNERFLFATGLAKPIWLNNFFPWGVWDSRAFHSTWPLTQSSAMVPDLPPYLQDLAWRKSFPNEMQSALTHLPTANYPHLEGVADGAGARPMKYVNYQTESYTLGSATSSWGVNTCDVQACAFWNNSRATAAPLGSPEKFCALYPHYVVNGMSFLDRGDIYFDHYKRPGEPLADDKGGPRGPWMREFIEFGRMGVLQAGGTLIASYTAKPGTHYSDLTKSKVQRASAAMFLMRWTDGTDGLFVNREPVRQLPRVLQPGDWWLIEDGAVYAAVRPLETTRLRGGQTILEKRARHIVLYEDNVDAPNIDGISDTDWVQARSGFVIEMGSQAEYGSFARFQEQILAGHVTDEADGFTRHIAYQRGDRNLDLRWHSYSEEYASRQINGRPDPWVRFLQSPEFAVSDSGQLAARGATLRTTPGKTMWLLACGPSQTWVAYQPNAEQELPVELSTPAAHLSAASFPFGKIALQEKADHSLSVEIDASYQPFYGGGKRLERAQRSGWVPSEIVLETAALKVKAQINGLDYQPRREERAGQAVWVLNPYDNARALLETTRASKSD